MEVYIVPPPKNNSMYEEAIINRTLNRYHTTAETLSETRKYGIVHIFADANGYTHEVILKDKFNSMQEAELFAKKLNDQNS